MRLNFTFGSVVLTVTCMHDPNLAKHPASGLGLSAEEKAALVAFLKALTDEPFVSPNSPAQQLSKTK